MSRTTRSAGLWVTILVVFFLVFAGGAALTYMAVARPAVGLVPEVAAGDESGAMAGVRISYSPRMPIWILIRLNVDPGLVRLEHVGPVQVRVVKNGEDWRSMLCSRTMWQPRLPTLYLCSITISSTELGEGIHRLSVVVDSITIAGKPVPIGSEAVRLVVIVYKGFWYYREIQLEPIAITREQLPPAG